MKKVVVIYTIFIMLLFSVTQVGAANSKKTYDIGLNNQNQLLQDWDIKEVEEYNAQRSTEFEYAETNPASLGDYYPNVGIPPNQSIKCP